MGNTLHRLEAGMSLEPVDSSNSMSGIPTFGGQRSNCLHHKTFVGLPWLVEQRERTERQLFAETERWQTGKRGNCETVAADKKT